MRELWASFLLAQEMGARLERGKVLFQKVFIPKTSSFMNWN